MQKYLVVGLGNIGEKYMNTRHNIGFLVADALASSLDASFDKSNFGSISQAKYKGRQLFILKPDTYMNLSGEAVVFWMKKEKILIENLLIITDDLNLTYGTIRIKTKGSNGGHNGLKSIEFCLQTAHYNRLRIGIGNSFGKGEQIDFVLGEWSEEESKNLDKVIDKSKAAVLSYCFHGIAKSMSDHNGEVAFEEEEN